MLKFFKTLLFNFYYFPLGIALKLPVKVGANVYLRALKGKVKIVGEIKKGMIHLGVNTIGIYPRNHSSVWENYGSVTFSANSKLSSGFSISVGKNAQLYFNKGFYSTGDCKIITHKKIIFGNDVLVSWDTKFMDTDFHQLNSDSNQAIDEDIVVGDNVWISQDVLVVKGSVIANDCVIAAKSLVNKHLDKENTLYGGIPAKAIKGNILWKR